eukprot:PhF_6_TR14175/c0_g1_i1/m.22693/K00799/GST, gst; glutathione S-transferase
MTSLRALAASFEGPHVGIVGSYRSPYVRKVLCALLLKGCTYEIDPISPFFGNSHYQAASPLSRVPVLLHEGNVFVDSSVICEYLDEKFTGKGQPLYPDRSNPVARARARWIEEFSDTRLADINIWEIWNEISIKKLVQGKEPDQQKLERVFQEDVPPIMNYIEELVREAGMSQQQAPSYIFNTPSPLVADIALCTSFRNLQLAGYKLSETYGDRWPLATAYILNVL